VDLAVFHPAGSTAHDKVRIGCIKKLEEWYGIEYLIQSFRLLLDSHGEERVGDRKLRDAIELVIVGEGSHAHSLRQLANDLAIGEYVRFLGAIPHRQVPATLNELDIVCVPTIVNESFGVVAVEAAACSLPVIASRVGGMAEVVRDGETGYLVPAGDPWSLAERLYALIVDAGLRARMGAAGRRLVEQEYDWSKNVDRMEALYYSLLSDSSRDRVPRL
jgi:glycosyltransferase involved in cell wall biosynthesis